MKKNILAIYNCLIPIIIFITSLSSIFKYEWWKGILLFINACIFIYIFWNNSKLFEYLFLINEDVTEIKQKLNIK